MMMSRKRARGAYCFHRSSRLSRFAFHLNFLLSLTSLLEMRDTPVRKGRGNAGEEAKARKGRQQGE